MEGKETRRKTRIINDQKISHISNEGKFFALIEQRYFALGYELIETCRPVQHA